MKNQQILRSAFMMTSLSKMVSTSMSLTSFISSAAVTASTGLSLAKTEYMISV